MVAMTAKCRFSRKRRTSAIRLLPGTPVSFTSASAEDAHALNRARLAYGRRLARIAQQDQCLRLPGGVQLQRVARHGGTEDRRTHPETGQATRVRSQQHI